MKFMNSLQLIGFALPWSRAMRVSRVSGSKSSFGGQWHQQRRSLARQSKITMMPEGPEVRTIVDQLQGGVGRRLVDIQFLSGRYVRHGRPNGFEAFAKTMTPAFQPHDASPTSVDILEAWNAKGKFIYITLDDGIVPPDEDSDFKRSMWVTLGMTGQFVNEQIHEDDPRFARWYLELMDVASGSTSKIYYHDQRNFGTLKFCLSRKDLEKKLESIGPDILDTEITEDDFLSMLSSQRPGTNICKVLMNQSKIGGVGNYILSECLYRANIDPFASISELNEAMMRRLYHEILGVARESYDSQGLTRRGGSFRNVKGDRGSFEFLLQCYGRDQCIQGNVVVKDTDGPHKRTIWYTEKQLLIPLDERRSPISTPSKEGEVIGQEAPTGGASSDTVATGDLLAGLEDPGWRGALSDATNSESFHSLQAFLAEERASGFEIYPAQEDVFSAFNLCPLDNVKVVIVGQDPYMNPGQGHGLAFSVRHGVKSPPSLKNIVREALADVGIEEPMHGNLEHWARQGVLLFNTVLTVRRGEANSHSKHGWEDFTDDVIRVLNQKNEGLVFLLWGNPAAKKAKGVDESRHVVIKTSHPSPLGATKTKSPFLGSRCFSRTNQGLEEMGKAPIDWNVE